jgi:hypothetical protein
MKRRWLALGVTAASLAAVLVTTRAGMASDHDDGETASGTAKNRNLNLTDHFAFKSPSAPGELAILTYTNPRSLPGHIYTMATNARYEQHISKVVNKTDAPTTAEDFVFRYEFGDPDDTGAQPVTVTLLEGGTAMGSASGMSTGFADSKAGTIVNNDVTIANVHFHFFVGARADSFYFDVIRFFQVRAFAAQRFFGGAGGIGDPTATLAPNCKGQNLLAGVLGTKENDGDEVNLFNPPECAPDFTHNYNITSIDTNVDISALGGGTVFDTWSTISLLK